MRIAQIAADNFRSIKRAPVAPSAFSVLVGQSNHGNPVDLCTGKR